ncbi:MAG TPA: gamma-glutamylcyclotransferase [Drouetiella sp.]|jgi:gamma-glutamylcyclotransferase (GGCT)/AIG2-like uncharacterized protein YtfP
MAKIELSLIEVTQLIDTVNKARTASGAVSSAGAGASAAPSSGASAGWSAEQRLNEIFGTDRALAVYGTLAPGRENYHIVEPLGGEWTDGLIEGDLQETGWGATLGYPAFRPRTGGTILKIKVLRSDALPQGWKEVDDFEGPEYERILVPVYESGETNSDSEPRIYTVANLYAAKD